MKIHQKAAAAVAVVSTVLLGFATAVSAQTPPAIGTQVSDGMQDWSDQAQAMVPALITAGLALFGVTLLIRFGKRVFGASK